MYIYINYALKITKIYVKNNTSKKKKIHQLIKSKTKELSFVKHYQRHFI